MSDTIITVENLSKSYLVGHQHGEPERYTALRDVIARNARELARKTRDMLRGRPIVQGDAVEEFWALKDVSFEVKRGETLGIIGRNGAGKSTLLKILSRITEPTKGRIILHGRVASLLEVGTGFHPELTGRENIYLNGAILGMTRAEIRRKFDEIVDFAEVERFLDTPVKRYSSGMYVRLAFAVAAHLEPEILVVDEVLAVGDVEFQKKCLGKMSAVSKEGRTVLFVSHNMPAIHNLCQSGLLLSGGIMQKSGNVFDVVSAYLAGSKAFSPSAIFLPEQCLPIQYIFACVKDNSGRVRSNILDSEGFVIELEIEVREQVTNIYFGLILRNSDGINILFADSRDSDDSIPNVISIGTCRYRLKIPNIFSPDTYSVTLGISNYLSGQSIQLIDSAFNFEIVQNRNFQRTCKRHGLINMHLRWEPS